ncbi:O-antigen ligase family protein [Nafulsella turpanensis]|uniref:O-antigen ligase family protein n=1 Tax=Nafulsella turpanensis TaxID=1265690 RepID=UPI00034BE783|nr:O-antigen ligase family protein [Nafulsella turpanensis]
MNKTSENLIYYSFLVLSFSISFPREVSQVFLIIFLIAALGNGIYCNALSETVGKIIRNPPAILGIVFFAYNVLSLYWTDEISKGFFALEKRLSLLLFPIVFTLLSTQSITFKNKDFKIKMAFVYGTFLSSLLCLALALYQAYSQEGTAIFSIAYLEHISRTVNQGGNFFFGSSFSKFHHPSYFSMYIVFAISIVLENLEGKKGINFASLFIILIFLIMLFLLSSKAGIISLLLLILYIIYRFRETIFARSIFKYSIAVTVPLLLLFLILSPRFHSFINEFKNGNRLTNSTAIDVSSSTLRLMTWKSSIIVIEDNFFTGVGIGDSQKALLEVYKENNFIEAFNNHLNSHNQYLDTFIKTGVVGFIILILWLVVGIKRVIPNNQISNFFFFILIPFNFLFETMLARYSGIIFICFFYYYITTILNENSNYRRGKTSVY